MTEPRRTRSGGLVPVAIDQWRGLQEAERLAEELGVDVAVTMDQAHALGVALAEKQEQDQPQAPVQDQELTDDQLRAMRRVRDAYSLLPDREQDQARDHRVSMDPRKPSSERAQCDGTSRTSRRGRVERPAHDQAQGHDGA
jgi:hypothetical protein